VLRGLGVHGLQQGKEKRYLQGGEPLAGHGELTNTIPAGHTDVCGALPVWELQQSRLYLNQNK